MILIEIHQYYTIFQLPKYQLFQDYNISLKIIPEPYTVSHNLFLTIISRTTK